MLLSQIGKYFQNFNRMRSSTTGWSSFSFFSAAERLFRSIHISIHGGGDHREQTSATSSSGFLSVSIPSRGGQAQAFTPTPSPLHIGVILRCQQSHQSKYPAFSFFPPDSSLRCKLTDSHRDRKKKTTTHRTMGNTSPPVPHRTEGNRIPCAWGSYLVGIRCC